MTTRTDQYYRNVKGLAILDSQTYTLQIDLGFGVLQAHTVRVTAPILDGLDEPDLLRQIFGNATSVVVQTDKPLPSGAVTSARLWVDDVPLGEAVARAIANRQGEMAL
jgi:hypothetical protein